MAGQFPKMLVLVGKYGKSSMKGGEKKWEIHRTQWWSVQLAVIDID